MKFETFWPMYLHGHRLPGTRALHYFATAVGILGAVEAVAARQPLIFVAGIGLGYMIAIGSHWLVERNQPLISVSMFWGVVADLRMCWLALRGGLAEELRRNGTATAKDSRAPQDGRNRHGYLRYGLLAMSVIGLAAGLGDLADILEGEGSLHYPIVQLGAPVVAFAAAFCVGARAIVLATTPKYHLNAAGDSFPVSVNEQSLWRAYPILLAFGVTSYALAELTEHGFPASDEVLIAICLPMVLISIGLMLTRNLLRVADGDAIMLPVRSGPETLGVRVDGRVKLVDFLENCLSFGQRREILAATLAAAGVGPGDRILDVGCGTGELAVEAAKIVSAFSPSIEGYAMGVDATPGMIDLAQQRARQAGIPVVFEVAAAESLPLGNGIVEAVTSSFFFHHLPSQVKRQALQEMWRVLAPGGRLVITDYGRPQNLLGLIASFPMRFNFHEYVRGQLKGELEDLIASEAIGMPVVWRSFLGYINVLVLKKPPLVDRI